MPTVFATQPQTYLSIIKRSLQLYKQSFLHVYALAALAALIYFVPRLYTLFIHQDLFNGLSYLNPLRAWTLFTDIVGFVFFMAMLWRMYCFSQESHEKFFEDLTVVIKKLPVILVSIVIQIALLAFIVLTIMLFYQFFLKHQIIFPENREFQGFFWLGLILVINMAIEIYLLFLFVFYMPLILIENKGVFSSLKKSAILVWRNWWRTFWVVITPPFCYFLALIFIKYILNLEIHVYFTGPLQQFLWGPIILQMIIFSLFLPWLAAVLLVQLRDLELRKKVYSAPEVF